MPVEAENEVASFCKHEDWLVGSVLPYNVIIAAKTANCKVLTSVSVAFAGVECVVDIDAFTIRFNFRKAYVHSWHFVVKAFIR